MAESVIFNSPVLIAGYSIALFFCIFDLFKHSSGYIFPVISAVACVTTTVAALILGAGLYEVALVMMVFLALNLSVYWGKGQK